MIFFYKTTQLVQEKGYFGASASIIMKNHLIYTYLASVALLAYDHIFLIQMQCKMPYFHTTGISAFVIERKVI